MLSWDPDPNITDGFRLLDKIISMKLATDQDRVTFLRWKYSRVSCMALAWSGSSARMAAGKSRLAIAPIM